MKQNDQGQTTGILWRTALACLGGLLLIPAAQAAPAAGKVYGDWGVACSEESKRCVLSQSVSESDSGKRVLKLDFSFNGVEPRLLVLVPLGPDLTTPAQLKLDKRAPVKLVWKRCLAEGCQAEATLTADQLGWLKTAQEISIAYFPGDMLKPQLLPRQIPMSPRGLGEGIGKLK